MVSKPELNIQGKTLSEPTQRYPSPTDAHDVQPVTAARSQDLNNKSEISTALINVNEHLLQTSKGLPGGCAPLWATASAVESDVLIQWEYPSPQKKKKKYSRQAGKKVTLSGGMMEWLFLSHPSVTSAVTSHYQSISKSLGMSTWRLAASSGIRVSSLRAQ